MASMPDLLAWSTGQGQTSPDSPNYAPPRPLEELDPGLIDTIKPNAFRMRDAMAIAIDESKSEQERLVAFREMELLILTEFLAESNDIDMEALKLWEPILNLITSPIPAISARALWVIGNIVEDKPESQTTFLKHEPFPAIIYALSSEKSADDVRATALDDLCCALRFNREAVVKFTEAKGWKALKAAVEDPNMTFRQKAASLLKALLLPSSPPSPPETSNETSDMIRSAIDTHKILSSLTSSVVNPRPFGLNADETLSVIYYEATAVEVVVKYLEGMKWSQTGVGKGVKKDLRTILEERKTERGKGWQLQEERWDVLQKAS